MKISNEQEYGAKLLIFKYGIEIIIISAKYDLSKVHHQSLFNDQF